MALRIPVQKDIGEYEEKIVGKMSLRTLACVSLGFGSAVGAAAFVHLGLHADVADAAFPIMLCSMPFWLAGFWRPFGMRAEELLPLLRHTSSPRSCSRTSPASAGASPRARRARAARDVARGAGQGRKEPSSMSRARSNKENRPKRPSTLGLLLGGTGGRKDASKGAEAERQRRRRERDRSREMAAYVGYDAMYRDGIAQVMPGVFSQTVEFSDISYQSARKEARETAFTVMSSLFNYFPADSHVQLQVVNAPIPADEVGRKVFFEPGERATAGLAEEYNRILNDKMREGVSNLVRHRYLTYAVGADDVDAAVPKLARIRGDVEQTLARIRCSSRALDGVERLELLQGQLRPGSRFEFSWDKLSPTSGARTKDFVMPSTLDFKPEGRSDCFRSDGRYGAVLAVRSFGSVIEETYLASIIDLPLPLNVTLHVQPIAQSEALALVKRQIDWMDKEIIDEQMSAVKKGYDYQILPPELRFSKEEAEELLDFLRNKSERLFVYTGLVYTWADSLEELDRRVQQVTSVAQGCTIGLEPLHFRQRQALNSVLPLGDNHVTVSRYLTTGQVAMQMPFASQSLDEAGGGYYGQSRESGNLVLCDRKRLASPMGFVCGKPGSGKSFSVKRR